MSDMYFENNAPFAIFDNNGNVTEEQNVPQNIQNLQTPIGQEQPMSMPMQMQQPIQTQEPLQATRVRKTPQEQPVQQHQPVQAQVQQTQPVQQQVMYSNMNSNVIRSNSTEENLALLYFKQSYTEQEWQIRREIYAVEIGKIHVDGNNVTPSDISVAAGRIDALLTPLRIDHMNAQIDMSRYENLLKLKKELKFNTIKQQNPKLTIDDIKSLIAKEIESEKNYEEGIDLYDANNRFLARTITTKGSIDALQDKKDLLITYSAMLKVENTASGFSASVPTDGQMNQMRG